MLNKNGLTFSRWLYAANFGRQTPMQANIAYDAWKRGEDPTEYACQLELSSDLLVVEDNSLLTA